VSRKRFEKMNCGVAQALEQVGDWWTLLIVRANDEASALARSPQNECTMHEPSDLSPFVAAVERIIAGHALGPPDSHSR
jgi:hypothetical protein